MRSIKPYGPAKLNTTCTRVNVVIPKIMMSRNVRHSVKALTDGRAIIVDYPLRRDFNSSVRE